MIPTINTEAKKYSCMCGLIQSRMCLAFSFMIKPPYSFLGFLSRAIRNEACRPESFLTLTPQILDVILGRMFQKNFVKFM